MVREVIHRRRAAQRHATPLVVTRAQEELIAQELDLLDRLLGAVADFPITPDDRASVEEAAERLTSLFLLVIVGEFNAGKSAFINALAGAPVMPEGVLPTTAVINLLRRGDAPAERVLPDGIIERTWPAPFLDDITVVDTPGTNAIIREHEALTRRFVPRADLVLFVTSADRPFTESERAFMESIREWGKKIVVVINKIDLVRDASNIADIERFVAENIGRLLGFTPDVFPVSALQAQQAKALEDRNPEERQRLWAGSRFGALEEYIVATLDEEGRVRLKLLSPLGVGEKIAERYLEACSERLAILREDGLTLGRIEEQLTLHEQDMRAQFAYHRTRIENVIARLIQRGDDYFEETIRLGRVFDLMNSDKIKADFHSKVVGDSEKEIDEAVDALIDWMVEQDLRTWQAVNEYIDRRRLEQFANDIVGEISGQFRYDRRALLDASSRKAGEEVARYDAKAAAATLSASVRSAVTAVAVAEVGAIGLGAAVVAAASTVAVDVTGLAAASLIAGLGLVILPRKRKQSRKEFRARATALEERLIAVMSEQFDLELAKSTQRIRDAIAPYSRFVRGEQDKLGRIHRDTTGVQGELRALRLRIGEPEPRPFPASATATPPSAPTAVAGGDVAPPLAGSASS
jgi:small GTP-binding protein